MQNLFLVSGGPSSKTWPRWAPQRGQCASTRFVKNERSSLSPIFSSAIGCQKLGQPVPQSYLASQRNRSVPQATQVYTPVFLFFSNAPVNGRSVPCFRVT